MMNEMREKLFGACHPVLKREPVKFCGLDLFVQEMDGATRDRFEVDSVVEKKFSYANLRARLAVLTLVDADGARVFADTDAEAVGKFPARELDNVFEPALRLSGLRKEDMDESVAGFPTPLGGDSPNA